MMARSSAASRASGATRQALPRLAMIAALVIAATTMGASTTLAAKGGNAAGAPQYSTIALAGSMLQSTDASAATFSRGSSVWFDTSVVGLKGTEYPMVYVGCFVGETKVWGNLRSPDEVFVLGNGSNDWSRMDPPPDTTCTARLYAYGGKAIRELTDPAAGVVGFTTSG